MGPSRTTTAAGVESSLRSVAAVVAGVLAAGKAVLAVKAANTSPARESETQGGDGLRCLMAVLYERGIGGGKGILLTIRDLVLNARPDIGSVLPSPRPSPTGV